VRVIGNAVLRERYARALERAGVRVERGPEGAAARGLWRIARAGGLI
jgi:2-keto-3-deoxy-galactonokinase